MLQNRYSNLSVKGKLFVPLFFVFLGIWSAETAGIGYLVSKRLEKLLVAEIEELSSVVQRSFAYEEQILGLKARWIAESPQITQAIDSGQSGKLLQASVLAKTQFQLDLLKVIDAKGSMLVELQQPDLEGLQLQDSVLLQEADTGFAMMDLVASKNHEGSTLLLAGLTPIKSTQGVVGGIIVGITINDALLYKMRSQAYQHFVVFYNSEAIASTLKAAKIESWQPPPIDAPPIPLTLDGQRYLAKTVSLSQVSNTQGQFVLLNSMKPLEEAEHQLWVGISLLCATGAAIAALLFFYTSRAIARPIQNLTEVAQKVTQNSDFNLQVPITTQDEVGILGKAFNQLIQQVKTLLEAQAAEVQQQQHLSEELQTAKQAADTANTAKSEFLANMSHELRTPLNAILGFTQILQRSDTSPAQQREYIDIIHRSGEHLLALINDILEMSKIEAGRISLTPNNFDLYRLLDTLEEMFDLRAQSKGLQLLFERSGEVPQYLCTDENKLRQVLINLLGNAIKFTPEGGVVLRVGVFQSSVGTFHETSVQSSGGEMGREGEPVGAGSASPSPEQRVAHQQNRPSSEFVDPGQITLHFEVEDSGVGIAPEEIDNIFKAFSQTESGVKSQEGTGLGLPISRKFVELLGGELSVSSTLNRGSIFHFTLPVTRANPSQVEEALVARRVVGLAPDQTVPRILAVEDNPINRKLLVQVLQNAGLEVRQASNGQEAIEIWREWQPDLIWMDMRMPVMDGYQATQTIKANLCGQETVIVALTASALEEDRTSVLAAGCDDFVRKPFREAEIFATMEKFLGLRYVYEDSASGLEKEKDVSSTLGTLQGQIEQMPSQWVRELEDAAIQGLDDRIFELIEEMPPEGNGLAQRLTEWARDFEFDRILELLPGQS